MNNIRLPSNLKAEIISDSASLQAQNRREIRRLVGIHGYFKSSYVANEDSELFMQQEYTPRLAEYKKEVNRVQKNTNNDFIHKFFEFYYKCKESMVSVGGNKQNSEAKGCFLLIQKFMTKKISLGDIENIVILKNLVIKGNLHHDLQQLSLRTLFLIGSVHKHEIFGNKKHIEIFNQITACIARENNKKSEENIVEKNESQPLGEQQSIEVEQLPNEPELIVEESKVIKEQVIKEQTIEIDVEDKVIIPNLEKKGEEMITNKHKRAKSEDKLSVSEVIIKKKEDKPKRLDFFNSKGFPDFKIKFDGQRKKYLAMLKEVNFWLQETIKIRGLIKGVEGELNIRVSIMAQVIVVQENVLEKLPSNDMRTRSMVQLGILASNKNDIVKIKKIIEMVDMLGNNNKYLHGTAKRIGTKLEEVGRTLTIIAKKYKALQNTPENTKNDYETVDKVSLDLAQLEHELQYEAKLKKHEQIKVMTDSFIDETNALCIMHKEIILNDLGEQEIKIMQESLYLLSVSYHEIISLVNLFEKVMNKITKRKHVVDLNKRNKDFTQDLEQKIKDRNILCENAVAKIADKNVLLDDKWDAVTNFWTEHKSQEMYLLEQVQHGTKLFQKSYITILKEEFTPLVTRLAKITSGYFWKKDNKSAFMQSLQVDVSYVLSNSRKVVNMADENMLQLNAEEMADKLLNTIVYGLWVMIEKMMLKGRVDINNTEKEFILVQKKAVTNLEEVENTQEYKMIATFYDLLQIFSKIERDVDGYTIVDQSVFSRSFLAPTYELKKEMLQYKQSLEEIKDNSDVANCFKALLAMSWSEKAASYVDTPLLSHVASAFVGIADPTGLSSIFQLIWCLEVMGQDLSKGEFPMLKA